MDSFRAVKIGVSPKQVSRLRNGHKVRIMKGEGFNLIVHPSKYNHITKAFGSGKGATVQLSPEELSANMGVEGGSIFGKKADRAVKKVIGKKAVKEIHSVAKAFQPLVEEGLDALGMMATTYGVPPEAVSMLTGAAKGYIDKPADYRGKSASQIMGKLSKDAIKGVVMDKAGAYLNETNPELYSKAKEAQQNYKAIQQDYKAIKAATQSPVMTADAQELMKQRLYNERGYGLYAGSGNGLYAGRGYGVMGRGAMMSVSSSHLPPALQSQNSSANFHFSTQLGPQFAALKGQGLY